MIGRTIGKYRVLEQIGRGGMGTVYRALDETLDRPVAIKMMNADLLTDETVQRFRGEAVTLARLSHPHIAAIHELTRDDHDLVMVMEFVGGETCERLLQRIGPFPLTRAIDLCTQVLDALEHAHRAGVVHRDLKPSNIMVTSEGEVKVMDFGVARVIGSAHLTTDGFMMGTPAYMAPEQVRGWEVDPRMDLYALAVVLYRLLTQHLPFEADQPLAMIHAQLHDAPTPPQQFRADLPAWIDAILTRGLAKSPGDRFQTAADFRDALEGGLNGSLTQATPTAFRRAFDATVGPVPTPPSMRAPAPAVMPTPVASTPSGRTDMTVTLQTRYLAAAGVLLGLLVMGVGVLAYAALRRTPPLVVHAPAIDLAAPPAASVSALGPRPANEGPNATPVKEVSAAPTKEVPAAPTKEVSGASPTREAPGAAPAPPRTTASLTPAVVAASKAIDGKSDRAGAPARVSAGPVDRSDREATAIKPAAGFDSQSFGDVKALLTDGAKSREQDALLSLEADAVVVRSRENGVVLKSLPYRSIGAATYSQSRKPRWSLQPEVAQVPAALGGSGFFLKTAKHWLALQTKTDFVVLRLDDRNVRSVLTSIDARSQVKVQRMDPDDKAK